MIDARGLDCPEPTNLLARALRKAKLGESETILVDSPKCAMDVQRFCLFLDNTLAEVEERPDGVYAMTVVKGIQE